MSVVNTSIEDLINGAGKNIDFVSFLKTLSESPKKSSKKKTKKETVCVEEGKDNIVVIDDSDKEVNDEETDEESDEDESEDEESEESEESEDETTDMLFNVLSNFLIDEQGNNIATSLTNIAYELHKLNSHLKTSTNL